MAELERILSKKVIILLTINAILGTGLFFLPARGAEISGSSSIISWAILSVIALYTIACFSELVGMFPKSGGIYEFSKHAYGVFPSFMIGWLTWIVENVTIAMLVVGAIDYVMPLGLLMHKIALAVTMVLLFNYITYRGVKTSAAMLIIFALITLSMALFVIISSFLDINSLMHLQFDTHFSIDNFSPFFSKEAIMPSIIAIIFTVFIISETFFGFEGICFLAGETKNPEKVLPRALMAASVITIIITFVFVVGFFGTIYWRDVSSSNAPFSDFIEMANGDISRSIFTFGVFFAIVGSAAGLTVTTPRLILSMAEDKLFPTGFTKIHEKYKTPHIAIAFQTVITITLIVVTLIQKNAYMSLVKLLIILVTIMMSLVIMSVLILRNKMPNAERPFKVPFAKAGIPLLILINATLVVAWYLEDTVESVRIIKLGLSLILFGIPIFLLLIAYYDPDIIIRLNNSFAYLNLAFEKMLLPRKVIKDINDHLDNIKGKRVLEFGCGVGTITKELVKKVGPSGFVYATDVSFSAVKIAKKRTEKAGYNNVFFIHDIHQVNRVHRSIPEVDIVISFGMLGYIQDLKKVLKEIARIMPDGGKIFFADYVDLFKVIPNVNWLSDETKLVELFRECGFSVRVRKETSPVWNYLYIYGIKTDSDVPYI